MRAYYSSIFILAAMVLPPSIALSQAGPPGLKAAVEAAWQRSPQGRTLEARRNEIVAGRDAAQTWLAGSPTIGLAQRSDRWTQQNGARETEVSISAPIWLPGQKSARQNLAESSAEELEAQIANTRLAIAGEVRERLWAVAAAREALQEAEDHQSHLEDIAEEVMRRVAAGDLARIDGILAKQEVLAARSAVVSAEAKLQEALTRYGTLTGQTDIPPTDPEPIAATMRDPHPRMLAARAALLRSQVSLNVVNRTRSEPPTIGLSMRRDKDGATSAPANSVAFVVQIPIGTDSRNRPLEAAAQTEIASASAEAAQAEAMVRADIDLARQQLAGARTALEAATSRLDLAREHTALIEKAFRLGERGLAELLRAQSQLHDAEFAESQQRVALGLAHARLNQALGITP